MFDDVFIFVHRFCVPTVRLRPRPGRFAPIRPARIQVELMPMPPLSQPPPYNPELENNSVVINMQSSDAIEVPVTAG